MKRKFSVLATPPATPDYARRRRASFNLESRCQNGVPVSDECKNMLSQVTQQEFDQDSMDVLDDKKSQVLVFLDAQGNQFVETIDGVLDSVDMDSHNVCVSCNMKEVELTSMLQTTNKQARQLSRYLGVLDPLGGALYPLNYLVIIHDGVIILKSPIKMSGLNPFQKFGIPIDGLKDVLEDVFS